MEVAAGGAGRGMEAAEPRKEEREAMGGHGRTGVTARRHQA